MARRRGPRRPQYRKSNKVFARTAGWSSTYYYRLPNKYFDLRGLNTTIDDISKPDGKSPYLYNIRLYGEDEITQRAPVMSRKGRKKVSKDFLTVKDNISEDDIKSHIDLWEGRVIQWDITAEDNLLGVGLYLQNQEKAKGFVRLSVIVNDEVFTSGTVEASSLPNMSYIKRFIRFSKTPPEGKVTLRLEVVDDVDAESCEREDPVRGKKIRVFTGPQANHSWADYKTPNTNECLKEERIEFSRGTNAPLSDRLSTTAETMPRGFEACCGGKHYAVYPVRNGESVEIWRTELESGITKKVAASVDDASGAVRFEQAGGKIFYVDGYSPLQEIDCKTWKGKESIPAQSEIQDVDTTPEQLTAKPGASLIKLHNNRLYLSGFKDDPNYVEGSIIDNVTARYNQFRDFFYVPNESAEDSACEPITAFARLTDHLVIFTTKEKYNYHAPMGLEYGNYYLQLPEGHNLGVLNQEAVCEGRNNIYFYNRSEGIMRYAGNTDANISTDIENELDAITNPHDVFIDYFDNRVRFYYSKTGSTNDQMLMFYVNGNDWVRDNNICVASAFGVQELDRYFEFHAGAPIVMEEGASDMDLGSTEIEAEYTTRYIFGDSPAETIRLRRIVAVFLGLSTDSVFIGVDTDKKDNPSVWRKVIVADTVEKNTPDDVFDNAANTGMVKLPLFMNKPACLYQIRVKMFCRRGQMALLGFHIEAGKEPIL